MTAQAESGWTPGPWFARSSDGRADGMFLVGANSDERGVEVDGPSKNGGIYIAQALGPDREANARLIAAAPDLHDALCEAPCPVPGTGDPDDITAGQCHALGHCGCIYGDALAKAQGTRT